jgi:predicted GNAT family acetyltransferase
MVVSVATMMVHRGKGLMCMCLSRLCQDVLAEGKSLCLFYDNPEAGKVYHRLGFKSIDNWVMMTEK